jgi:hypothetical protein
VAEQALPLVPVVAEILALGLLITPRDAPGVALGRLHVGPAAIELALLCVRGALARPALPLFAVRRHRSSIVEVQAYRNYHVHTG